MINLAHVVFVCCLLLCGCKSNHRALGNSNMDVQNMKSTHQHNEIPNADSTLLLKKEVKAVTPEQPFPFVMFSVIDVKLNKILYEGKESNAEVDWHDRDHLRITKIPETVMKDQTPEETIFLLNVHTGKMVRLSDTLNPNDYQKK